jgi:GT2 family glycosyltransferase
VNAGISLARGRLVTLLDSAVLPAEPGWLSAMATFYDATPGIGALGSKLLYEDDGLHHAGFFFSRDSSSAEWEISCPYRGLDRHLELAAISRPVPAVSAACLMISTELYRELGGLRGMYVGGENEDVDLCMRLRDADRENWYLSTAELYYLAEPVAKSPAAQLASRYNRWLTTHLWGTAIQAAMERHHRLTAESPTASG